MGERKYSSYSFTTSALNGGERSASRPSRALRPVDKSVARHYTDWATPALRHTVAVHILQSRSRQHLFQNVIYNSQGYLCNGTRRSAVPEALSQNDASRNGVPGPFLPGTGITSTTPLRPSFRSIYGFRDVFQKKIALKATFMFDSYNMRCYKTLVDKVMSVLVAA
jgi:hypothetical protein